MRAAQPKSRKVAEASFTARWEEAIAVHKNVGEMRRLLRESYGLDNLQMRFEQPWRGPAKTGFSLAVELADNVSPQKVGAVRRELLWLVKTFLKSRRRS